MMTHEHQPLRSIIHVSRVGEKDERIYEAVTDESNYFYGVTAKQLSGPPLELRVSECRSTSHAGRYYGPTPPSRWHIVCVFRLDPIAVPTASDHDSDGIRSG